MMSVHGSVLIYLFLLGCTILVTTATKDTAGEDPCPSPSSSVKHWKDPSLQVGCFAFLSAATFEGAKSVCESTGGFLVGDDSVYLQPSLAKFYKDSGRSGKVWIGATRDTSVDKWKWMYSKQNVTFNLWSTGQPNNHGGNENCILWDGADAWDAVPCDSTSNGVLCQYYGEQGKMWGEWSEWSEVSVCSRRCGGGNQKLRRSRSCSSAEGCDGESEYTQRDCYSRDCQCKTLSNRDSVTRFCNNFQKRISYLEKEDFCKFSKTEKLEALLCTQINPAEAETLLNVAYENNINKNCKYDPTEVFDGDCGQLLQDKLSKSCSSEACQEKQSEVQRNIDKVIEDTDKLYKNKIGDTNTMFYLMQGQLALRSFIDDISEEETTENYEKKQKKIMGDVVAKLKKNENMGKDEKNKFKEKAFKMLSREAVSRIDISAATTKLDNLEEKEKHMKKASTGIKKQYGKLKEKIKGMSSPDKLEKAGTAVYHVLGSITKFQKGDTMSVIGGVLDIAAGISQFLPPPASIITGTISSIFAIFSGSSAPSTEDVIKDEFKKQKEWMEKKFDEVDNRFDGLEVKIKNYFEKIDDKLDKSFDDLKTAIQSTAMKLTESQKEILLLKGLTDQKRNALGIWHELELKLAFIIDNEGNDHDTDALSLIVQYMDFFSGESAKFKFRDFVETECKNKTSTAFREHCQVLAYAALMIERTDEIVLCKTMALLAKSGSFSSIDYSSLLEARKEKALKFFQDIFTSTDKNEYSYISCGLSEKSNAKLTEEQKLNLFAYAAHLSPKGRLTKRLKEREKCEDGKNSLPWKTYSRSSLDRNAALDAEMNECCKKGRKFKMLTCSAPKNGGVDCPYSSQCDDYITLGYCPGVKSNEIIPGTILRKDDSLISPNGKYKLVMQADGNLVFYSTRNPGQWYWGTHTANTCPGAYFRFQTDGNMVIYNEDAGVCWTSGTQGKEAGKLTITDDMDLKLTRKTSDNDNDIIWNMRTFDLQHRETSGFTLDGGVRGTWALTWGPEERCKFPHFVHGMALNIQKKVERNYWRDPRDIPRRCDDNTALDGIALACSDGTVLQSTVGVCGEWNEYTHCTGSYINQAKIRKQDQNAGDESAANGIKFKCSGSNAEHSPGNGWFGNWQHWKGCPSGSAIIGLKTMVQTARTFQDNTGLNKVHFICAFIP